jgi:hypothetical protein
MQQAFRRHPGMVRACCCAIAFLLCSCATLKESPLWPSRTEPWCLPKAKYDHKHQKYYAGVRCAF